MTKLAEFIAGLILLIALVVAQGAVIVSMWAWFVVPTFSAPALSIAAAVGIASLSRVFVGAGAANKTDGSFKSIAVAAAERGAALLAVLLIGYVVSLFM